MSTQYRLVQSGKTASGGCSAGQGSSEPVAPRIYFFILVTSMDQTVSLFVHKQKHKTHQTVDQQLSFSHQN
jgi:carbohydrate-binding DOMON domain-containing protein